MDGTQIYGSRSVKTVTSMPGVCRAVGWATEASGLDNQVHLKLDAVGSFLAWAVKVLVLMLWVVERFLLKTSYSAQLAISV